MTREEAIANLKMIGVAFVEPITKEQGKLIDDTFDMAIKALKQESILDKIRAEIKHLRNFRAETYDLEQYCDNFDARIIFMDDVLQIIDKYKNKTESEVKK